MNPIESAMAAVCWEETGTTHCDGLYATHQGVIDLAGIRLPVYRLSNGESVFDADAVRAWLEGAE